MRSSLWLFLVLLLAGCPAKSPLSGGERLAGENSPYLRQHADNLVEWYPWGDEAFEKARAEDKPVFLSIGYSTCHWCHVMEEESFMNSEVADYLNRNFISIKVDRETRPDVDQVYMSFVQRATGSGGWPLTVFLTPDRTPFYGGTYFPHPPKYNKIGFLSLLENVRDAWVNERETLLKDAGKINEELRVESQSAADASYFPPRSVIDQALASLQKRYDAQYAGFLPAPKFPSPPLLDFLLRKAALDSDEQARRMVFDTLRAMALGGIHDHLAGGFHRYSVDREWLVPHFEKMLYDQAQLVSLYSQAYALNQEPLFREAVESTLDYLDQRMRSPEGAYYSAEDADSALPEKPDEHAEGAFYVWSYQELKVNLTPQELELVTKVFGVTEQGNASNDPTGELSGKNVLRRLSEAPPESLRAKLLKLREKRPRPHRDEKVLTEWNGLMAAALADAGRYLEDPERLEQSSRVLEFVETKMVVDGSLKRSYFDGKAEIDAFASDYMALIHAYLTLYQAGGDPAHLLRAFHWQERADELFWDAGGTGYFDSKESSELPIRRKSLHDGAEMATNTRACLNLSTLYAVTGNAGYGDKLEKLFAVFGPTFERVPSASPGALSALLSWYSGHDSVIIVADNPAWWKAVTVDFTPQRALLRVDSEESRTKLAEHIPFLPAWSTTSRAYRCKDFSCGLPVESLSEVESWTTKDVSSP